MATPAQVQHLHGSAPKRRRALRALRATIEDAVAGGVAVVIDGMRSTPL
jgi:hypothetical protein